MATQRQLAANQANAQKSTGPKTPTGKATVAQNAIRHGILSTRLFLEGEDPAEFLTLQDDLRQSLQPVGVLEKALVEKIAIALWRQKRLVAAETASLELNRTMRRQENRLAVGDVIGAGYLEMEISLAEIIPMSPEELERLAWCRDAIAEFDALDETILQNSDLVTLAQHAPCLFAQLESEAEDELLTQDAFLAGLDQGLMGWTYELVEWCAKELATLERRSLVQLIANWVKAEKSAPIGNELLHRYQVTLDGELYRAMAALRKQQEWRIGTG